MVAPRTLSKFIKAIKKLRRQRAFHAAALAEIDATFAELGLDGGGGGLPSPFVKTSGGGGLPSPFSSKRPAPTKGRKRRKFKQTAGQFILGLLDGKKLSTAQINAAWKDAGRGGTANVTLMNMVKAKKLTRKAVKGGRGSTYSGG